MLRHPPVRDLRIRCRILGLAEQVPFVKERHPVRRQRRYAPAPHS
jgi:hypothetical protein